MLQTKSTHMFYSLNHYFKVILSFLSYLMRFTYLRAALYICFEHCHWKAPLINFNMNKAYKAKMHLSVSDKLFLGSQLWQIVADYYNNLLWNLSKCPQCYTEYTLLIDLDIQTAIILKFEAVIFLCLCLCQCYWLRSLISLYEQLPELRMI